MLKLTPLSPTFVSTFLLTFFAMLAFAGNSVLCRIALKETHIDAMSFTSIRLVSGACVLWLIIVIAQKGSKAPKVEGSWPSALALFVYAIGFSFAYISMSTATGALILFSAVQATMIGYGLWKGERLTLRQWLGLVTAFIGLLVLLLPGVSSPPLTSAMLMLVSGLAWGIYSLQGQHQRGNPTCITAGNFVRTVPIALLGSLIMLQHLALDLVGAGLAIASGALASGLGYAVWYKVLPALKSTSAATIQLSVPVIAALGGIIFLGEVLSLRLIIATFAILGGIALVVITKKA